MVAAQEAREAWQAREAREAREVRVQLQVGVAVWALPQEVQAEAGLATLPGEARALPEA